MDHANKHSGRSDHYQKLFVMITLSFVAMYILMYSMVNGSAEVYNNINQVYMAGLMAAPMMAIELIIMRGMYTNSRLNAVLIAGSLVAAGTFFAGIRQQRAVNDDQFLRSMIPHHSGAILMCREADIEDTRIQDLCRSIIAGQQTEIEQMKAMLNE